MKPNIIELIVNNTNRLKGTSGGTGKKSTNI